MPSCSWFASVIFATAVLWVVPVAQGEFKDEPADPLQPLAWMVGGEWVAEMQGGDGKPLIVHVNSRWAENRKALHYSISFESQGKRSPQYDGTYYWHPGKKRIALLQVDQRGNVTESTMTTEGKILKQENVLTTADGVKHDQRVEITRSGEDAFTMKAFVERDGQWVEAVSFAYKRVRDKAID